MAKVKQLTFLKSRVSLDEVKKGVAMLFLEKPLRLAIYFNLLLIFANALVFLLFFSSLPPQVPLFYSRPWGKEQLAGPMWLVVLPAGSLLIFLGNHLLAAKLLVEEKILSQVLVGTSLFVALIALIGLLKIISLIY